MRERVRREAKKLHFFFYVVRFLSRLMSFLECTPRFQTELTLAALPDIPPRNCQNNYKSAEKTSVIGPKGIVNRLGGKKNSIQSAKRINNFLDVKKSC